jgi:hypothetical protein
MIRQHEHARREEHRIGELDDGEAAQVQGVEGVARDGEGREGEREAIARGQEDLDGDDGLDEARE